MVIGNNMLTAKFNLTSNEVKFVLYMIDQIKKSDKPNKEYCVAISDLRLKFNSVNTSRLITFCKDIMNHTLTIKKEKSFLVVNWFSHIEYKHEEQNIYFAISSKLSKELFSLEREFATPQLKYILNFKSIYTIRLYLLMYKIKNQVSGIFSIEEIKEQLKIKDKFSKYSHFKQKVLMVAEKELVGSIDKEGDVTEKSDIYFEYEEVKAGRKVVKIKFMVKSHKKKPKIYTGSLAQFQAMCRKRFVNRKLFELTATQTKSGEKVLLSVGTDGRIYNKYTTIQLTSQQAKEWWIFLHKTAQNGDLEVLK